MAAMGFEHPRSVDPGRDDSAPDERIAAHDGPIHGIVLAAGRSRRMGRAKALLAASGADRRSGRRRGLAANRRAETAPAAEGGSFIERAVAVLRAGGCDEVVAVLGSEDTEAAQLARAAGGRVAVNPESDTEQIESLRIGLATAPLMVAAVLVLPVDQPLVRASTVVALIEAFRSSGAPVARPTYRGEPGHPTLFAHPVFGELKAEPLPEGARAVVRAHQAELEDVAVDDPGVVADIDTPDDYRRYLASA